MSTDTEKGNKHGGPKKAKPSIEEKLAKVEAKQEKLKAKRTALNRAKKKDARREAVALRMVVGTMLHDACERGLISLLPVRDLLLGTVAPALREGHAALIDKLIDAAETRAMKALGVARPDGMTKEHGSVIVVMYGELDRIAITDADDPRGFLDLMAYRNRQSNFGTALANLEGSIKLAKFLEELTLDVGEQWKQRRAAETGKASAQPQVPAPRLLDPPPKVQGPGRPGPAAAQPSPGGNLARADPQGTKPPLGGTPTDAGRGALPPPRSAFLQARARPGAFARPGLKAHSTQEGTAKKDG